MHKKQLLTIIQQGVRTWNTWRKDHPTGVERIEDDQDFPPQLIGACLNGINFDGVIINNMDFGRAYLNDATLRGASLKSVNFNGAHLIEADFTTANLEQAQFEQAYLMGAKFHQANLRGASFKQAHLRSTNFSQANLAEAIFDHTDLRDADIHDANLQGICCAAACLSQKSLQRAQLVNADFSHADLAGADLRGADLRGVNFHRTNLQHANLSGANLSASTFQHADLTGANLSAAILRQADFRQAHLTQVNLCNADIREALFNGEDLWGVTEQVVLTPELLAHNIILNEATIQAGVIINQPGEPRVSVDQLEIAQFIYLLSRQQKFRALLRTVTTKVVLILGRFTGDRKEVLEAMRTSLRTHGYVPVVFEFEQLGSQDFTEMIATLTRIARFVLADFTDAAVAFEDFPAIVRNVPVPVQPLLAANIREEPGTLSKLRSDHAAILDTYRYVNSGHVLESFEKRVIFAAEAKARELLAA